MFSNVDHSYSASPGSFSPTTHTCHCSPEDLTSLLQLFKHKQNFEVQISVCCPLATNCTNFKGQHTHTHTHTHTHGNFKEFCQSPANRTAALMKPKRMTRRWILSFPVVPNFFGTRTGFIKDNFSMDRVVREGFRMIQERYICCALYYFYISSTSDHQTLDPRGWGPLF